MWVSAQASAERGNRQSTWGTQRLQKMRRTLLLLVPVEHPEMTVAVRPTSKQRAAAILGRSKSPRKAASSAENGAKGGRPQLLTGGRKALAQAIEAAYASLGGDMVVRYSHAKGFQSVAAAAPPGADVLWQKPAGYLMGGKRSLGWREYPAILATVRKCSRKPGIKARITSIAPSAQNDSTKIQ
jgi:hypothetical protein